MGRAVSRKQTGRIARGIKPMLSRLSDLPKNDAEYGFEYKWDGMRCIAYCDDEGVRIESRNLNDYTARYPELHAEAELLRRKRVILDGEVVALDDFSRPNFSLLQGRMHVSDPAAIKRAAEKIPVVFLVFDVLAIGGRSVMDRTYVERREILDELTFTSSSWQRPGWLAGNGKRMLANAREAGYEGVVAKRLDSLYTPGERSNAWLKIKVRQRQEFVVAGYFPGSGRNADRVGSLLLGYYAQKTRGRSEQVLRYAGNVGTGMSEMERAVLKRELDALKRPASPFAGVAPAGGPGGPVVFAQPQLVAEVSYAELTPGGILRHPVYHGLRLDKEPGDVVLEV